MQTKITTVTKTCDGPECHESLTIADNQPMTEQLAIALGMWLTVLSEIVTGDGVTVHAKQFCSIDCLNKYVTPLAAEYKAAEDKVLAKPQPKLTEYYSPEAKAALNREIESWGQFNPEAKAEALAIADTYNQKTESWEELRDRLKAESGLKAGTDGN